MYSVIKDWCGDSYPESVIKSTGDSATVSFSTNKYDNKYKGFKLQYWAETQGKLGVSKTFFCEFLSKWGPSWGVLVIT